MNKTYNATPDQIVAFRKEALANGLTIPDGNSGEVDTHGVKITFSYDGKSVLSLTILSKPWYIPASTVWGELDNFLPKQ